MISIEQREKELAWSHRPTGPYARLKLAMDYWCALWFWPIQEATKLPTRQQFLEDIAAIFAAGEEAGFEKEPEQLGFFETQQSKQSRFSDLNPFTLNDVYANNPRLKILQQVAKHQHFQHWELVFIEVFVERGGFDLLVGNPPWIKVKWDESGILSEYDPYLSVKGMSASEIFTVRMKILNSKSRINNYLEEYGKQTGIIQQVSSRILYSTLIGVQPNLYKCFIVLGWSISNSSGVSALIHDYGIYDDPNGQNLRRACYEKLKKVFRFYNQLNLFPEESLGHAGQYCISVFTNLVQHFARFELIANLFHPRTIDDSYSHDGYGEIPSMKTESGDWELRGHKCRIVILDETTLKMLGTIFEPEGTHILFTRLPIIHSSNIIDVMYKFSTIGRTILSNDDTKYYPTVMFDETSAENDGFIKRDVNYPKSIENWIISGPHFYVANPLAKNPRENCKSKGDYDDIDLTKVSDDYLPRSIYQPCEKAKNYIPFFLDKPVTDFYRFANRKMAQASNERTLIGAIIPPKTMHISSAFSLAFSSNETLLVFASFCSSILFDFFIRSTGKQNIREDTLKMLPFPWSTPPQIISRTLRLNCVTIHYNNLWEGCFNSQILQDLWSKSDNRLKSWSNLTPYWQRDIALRTPFERRQALVEIDVLAAFALGLTIDELLTIYRVQFPVLQKNERRLLFDQLGMEVPMKTIGGELGPDESHPKFPEMVPPFTQVDREEDYRVAWKYFEEKLKKEDTGSTG